GPARAASPLGRERDRGKAGHRRQTPPSPARRGRRPPVTAGPLADAAARLAARAAGGAVCLDCDGTIAPIVDDPAAARPLPGIVELLGPLADRYAAMALISGRAATYLASPAAPHGVRELRFDG